ncbi:MAG: HAD family hydrolase, partial [Actinomycetota bacterium]|nr:HAD family hydrolase [Actinomycetota bacterium]
VLRRPRPAAVAAAVTAAGIGELLAARLRPGPRTRDEVITMALTSIAVPFAATWHTLRGAVRHRKAPAWRGLPELVLFDRDGTLVVDIPYNGDPDRVELMPHARETCDRLRDAGVRLGVVSNQSGVARGLLTTDDVMAVNARISHLLGEFGTWEFCPHRPEHGCACRKPAPGMIHRACQQLDVRPERCVVVGDIGSDVQAALSAGAAALLVPTARTRAEEVAAAPRTVRDLREAADVLLGAGW